MIPAELRELRYLLVKASKQANHEERVRQGAMATCVGKFAFETLADAKRAVRKKGVVPYRCGCGKWHVGGTETSRAKRLIVERRRQEGAEV